MATFKSQYLFPIVLMMIIGTVKCRWLEVSDGVLHDTNINIDQQQNLPFLRMGVSDSEKRCETIYGFLPCADTIAESVFLMVMYTYVLMLGEEWLHKGSAALFMHFSNKKIAGSVFRVFMALPRVVMVIVSGALGTQADARNQVAFGVAMYAGSTVISLTGIWGVNVILNKEKLRGEGQLRPSELREKLSFFKDGVNINDDTRTMALIMLLSLIPFVVVLLSQVFNGRMMILFALIVSTISLFSYIAYQIYNPWIQDRSVVYLKQARFQKIFLTNLQKLTNENLYIKGEPNIEAIKRIFDLAVVDQSGHLTPEKLENFIHEKVIHEEDGISKGYAFEEIQRHFETDGTEGITIDEFKAGCISWLNKWNAAKNGPSGSQIFLNNFVADNKIEELAVMPRILLQPLINKMDVNENGDVKESEIEELFHKYDKDNDGEINHEELEKAIAGLNMAKQDPSAFARSIINELDTNESGKISKEEVITGLKKWSKMAKEHASGSNDLLTIIQRFATESWGFTNTDEEPEIDMLYVVLGAGTIYLFAGPFMQSVIQFSNALNIPFLFTSFVVAPFFMYARSMVIFAFSRSRKDNSNRNASLPFFELYSGLVMNNLMGLTTLLTIVYIRDLTWDYTTEVMTIIVIGLIMGTFARFRQTYPLWTSFLSFFLYVTTTVIFCVYAWERA